MAAYGLGAKKGFLWLKNKAFGAEHFRNLPLGFPAFSMKLAGNVFRLQEAYGEICG